jgi:membrane fusion protein (multidrug efflux system)
VKIDAFEDMPLEGTLESFGGATGAKFSLLPPDNSTGNFVKITQRVPVRIKLGKITEEQKSKLVPGLSVNVDVHTQN